MRVCRVCNREVEEIDLVNHATAHVINMDHLVKPSRQVRGEQVPTAKLKEQQVREIRKLLPAHTRPWIAEQYGVSVCAIDSIASGRTWRWLDAEPQAD